MAANMDGSWLLLVSVTDLSVEKKLRVKGDNVVGDVMFKLVESLAVTRDWSDHAFWWPERRRWLKKTRLTLEQHGVDADAKLLFTPMHKGLKVQLPDLQVLDLKVNFSVNVFNAVIQLCKDLGIRHPEEVSLRTRVEKTKGKGKQNGSNPNLIKYSSNNSLNNGRMNGGGVPLSPLNTPSRLSAHSANSPQGTLLRSPLTPITPGTPGSWHNGLSPATLSQSLTYDENIYNSLVHSPSTPSKEAFLYLTRSKTVLDKSMQHAGWLLSKRSLMEQGVVEDEVILLRFKYFSFYDLAPKYDAVRINQIYEQARWSLISEEVECTEEEMMMFAALQLQVRLQLLHGGDELDGHTMNGDSNGAADDVGSALNDLELSLQGTAGTNGGDILQIPELQDDLRHFKPRKYTLKGTKRYWFTLRDTNIYCFKTRDDRTPIMTINLRGCEIQQEVALAQQKFIIKLFVHTPEGLSEEWLKCDTEEQYARWMAACKLGCKGHTMASSSYNAEVKNIETFLRLQRPAMADESVAVTTDASQEPIEPADFLAAKYLKKNKTKQNVQKILEAHANVKSMTLSEAKTNYIKAWQALPISGLSYFIVKFKGNKKEEVLGVGFNRLIRSSVKTGDVTKTYRYDGMRAWSVNRETSEVMVDFEDDKLVFTCSSADCRIISEYIGGYIFLSMRAQEKNQTLNEELFLQLTSL